MGCWNISFWDNDECVDFLCFIFQHLALMPFPTVRRATVLVITNKLNQHKLLCRHEKDEMHELQSILASITATTLAKAKQADPNFRDKLFADKGFEEEGFARIGLTRENMWTLIHMHVGAPIDNIKELDALAKAFHVKKKGGTWVIDPYLKSFAGVNKKELEETRKQHAPVIRQGILQYKDRIIKGKPLKPMKLAFIGPVFSLHMLSTGMIPEAMPAKSVWDTSHLETTFAFPQPDPNFDDCKCATCKTLEAGREKPLKECPCGCVFYCSKACQTSNWKDHRRLHKLRRSTYDVVCAKEGPGEDTRTREEMQAIAAKAVARVRNIWEE